MGSRTFKRLTYIFTSFLFLSILGFVFAQPSIPKQKNKQRVPDTKIEVSLGGKIIGDFKTDRNGEFSVPLPTNFKWVQGTKMTFTVIYDKSKYELTKSNVIPMELLATRSSKLEFILWFLPIDVNQGLFGFPLKAFAFAQNRGSFAVSGKSSA